MPDTRLLRGRVVKVFQPSGNETTWKRLASELDGDFIPGHMVWPDRVVAKVRPWTITLESWGPRGTVETRRAPATLEPWRAPRQYMSRTRTRIAAPYVRVDPFHFRITDDILKRGCLSGCLFMGLDKLVKGQDIALGYREFDPDLIVKSNDELKARAIFANPRIRQLIQLQPAVTLYVSGGFSLPLIRRQRRQVARLVFVEEPLITDVERLKSLFELFGETLDELCRIGSASDEDPGVDSL
jgi:hypothetical protein